MLATRMQYDACKYQCKVQHQLNCEHSCIITPPDILEEKQNGHLTQDDQYDTPVQMHKILSHVLAQCPDHPQANAAAAATRCRIPVSALRLKNSPLRMMTCAIQWNDALRFNT